MDDSKFTPKPFLKALLNEHHSDLTSEDIVDILPSLSLAARRSWEREGRGFLLRSVLRLNRFGGFLLHRGA